MDDRVTAHFQESIAVKQASQSLVPIAAHAADVMAMALLEDGKVVGEETLFTEIGERLRDIRTAPDGSLYILTDSEAGKIVRITPRR